MNTGKKYSKMLFLVLLLAAFVAGCGESHTNNVPPNSAKAITAFSLNGASGAINETAKTIAVTMPFSTPSVTALVATFSTTGKDVKVGVTTQISGITPNNFTNPVLYTVTATDGTAVNYTVTVTVAVAPSSAKDITAYSLAGQVTSTIIGTAITVTMPFSTPSVTGLVATFSTTGAVVTVGTTTQVSGITPNDFTGPVTYTVTAADSTTQTYTVTLAAAPAPAICTGAPASCVDLGNAAIFSILTGTGITSVPTSTIIGTIGSSPITAAAMDDVSCSEVTGFIYGVDAAYTGSGDTTCFKGTAPDKTFVDNAVLDMGTAYTDAATKAPAGTCPGAGVFDGAVSPLAPGVYACVVDVTIPQNFILNGSSTDVWVFQITGTLTQSAGMTVSLLGGALPQNVFWQVSGVVTIGTGAHIEGVILTQAQINMLAGSSIKGRLLTQTGVALDTATVIEP
jgi:hypothetical protein